MIDLAGRRYLLQGPHAQQSDSVRHHHGFFLVMGYEHEGNADLALQGLEFHLHLAAQVGVEGGERFIEQQ